ncbi:hypothetical protein BH10PSE1_BH10PSE1_26720 [soil metagenome]
MRRPLTEPLDADASAAPTIPPLAEGRWLWRRIYVFAVSAGLWVLLAGVVGAATPATLPRIADGLLAILALLLVIYLVAPTTQQLIELMANLRLRLGRPDSGERP